MVLVRKKESEGISGETFECKGIESAALFFALQKQGTADVNESVTVHSLELCSLLDPDDSAWFGRGRATCDRRLSGYRDQSQRQKFG
jgi:hypothetical protein